MISLKALRIPNLIALPIFSILTLELPVIAQEGDKEPSPKEIAEITAKSLAILQNVEPLGKSGKPLKILETQGGTVRWGNLFGSKEIVALVNLAPAKPTEPYDYPPQYLSFFAWEKKSIWSKGEWVFRQFLGNAYNLEIHHRKDKPSHFLQGSYRFGRYEGEHLSWYYDEATKKLVLTGFEDWGPFYLAGDYLICRPGFRRLAHDWTLWVYPYKNGKKGELLAVYHESDYGHLDITYRDTKTGKMITWFFRGLNDEESGHYPVFVGEADDQFEEPKGDESKRLSGEVDKVPQGYLFELLTGLTPALLDYDSEKCWRDELPKREPLKRIAIKATGDLEIVKRLQWPSQNTKAAK